MIHMRFLRFLGGIAVFGTTFIWLLLAGCQTSDPQFVDPKASATNTPAANSMPGPGDRPEIINIGDSLTITFMDLPFKQDPIERTVASDGTITLIDNQIFTAAGKNRGELEREIRTNYVPRLYPRMTVTIKPLERFFFVGGEVRGPGAQRYVTPITVLKAIQSAGDFTDFAQRKKIRLTRLNGKKLTINWYDAQKDTALDPPVYPGDTIHVPRRMF
jgi:polysaccharide export outer membrane protein